MSQTSPTHFEFDAELSLSAIEAGTNLLVKGPSESGAREVALRLVMNGLTRDESALLVSADVPGKDLLERCNAMVPALDRTRLGIVDCASGAVDDQRRFESRHEPIDGPDDLGAINVELSMLYETLAAEQLPGIRLGVFSLSSLLLHASFQEVSRFVHMLTGRIIATDDLGVFLLDETALEPTVVDSLTTYCDGCLDVRAGNQTPYELRVTGLDGHSEQWRPLELDPAE